MQNNKYFWVRSRTDGKMIYVNSADPKHDLALAFFRVEVLDRYRARPSIYTVDEGFIICKEGEGWLLQSCYVSTKGEIYSYLHDLSLLPESEQEYWQHHNIKAPGGDEDSFAIERDFYCSFENSAKQELLQYLKKLEDIRITINDKELQIWKSKEDLAQMVNEVMRPLIEEYKQYRNDFLLSLSRLVVEGFILSTLQKWAAELNITRENNWGSLIILEECLKSIGVGRADAIMQPLRELHKDKSSRASHGGKIIEQQMVAKAKDTLHEVITSIIDITQAIQSYESKARLVILQKKKII